MAKGTRRRPAFLNFSNIGTGISLLVSVAALCLGTIYTNFLHRPEIRYTVTTLNQYPTSRSLDLAVKRAELPGFVSLRHGVTVHLRSTGRKEASNVQVRVTTSGETYVVQVHTDDSALTQPLPDIGRQGSQKVFIPIPLMVPQEEVKLTFWFGIPNTPEKTPEPPTIRVRHAEGSGQVVENLPRL